MDPIPLMAMAELRRRFGGISGQRMDEITHKPSWPKPVANLDVGRIWHRDDVEAWIVEHRKDLLDETDEADGTQPPA